MTQPSPLQWVALLYGGVTPPAGFVEFRFLKGGTRAWMPWPAFEGHPEEFHLTGVPKGQEAYWGVSLRKDTSDGKAANCHPTHLVWTDIDLKDHPELTSGQTDVLNMPAEELAEYKAELLRQVLAECETLNLPPRAIVDSGHGLQVYWARRTRPSDPSSTEETNRALAALFGGDTKSTDIARILRLPGTQNLKNRQRPLPVQVVYSDADAFVERDALNALPRPEKAAPAPAPAAPRPQVTGDTQHERYARTALAQECDQMARTGEGGRNEQLNRSAFNLGTLIGAGILDEVEATQELTQAARAAGLDDHEIRDTLRSGLESGKAKPRDLSKVGQLPPSAGRGTIGKHGGQGDDGGSISVADVLAALPEKPGLAHYRDLVTADMRQHDHVYRYHQVWRNWWEYRQGVYVEVPDEVMAQKVDLCLQSYGFTLKNAQVTEILTKIGRDPLIGSREVDQGAWELNTRSGVLDLASGDLYEHSPAYFSIIQSAAHWRPGSVAHDWLAFLRQAVPDAGDRELLQMFAGLCLTGETSPQRALLLVGDGGTGKSTFVRVLQAVLGNLATSSALENIKDGSFLVGTLVGKRMCVVSELQRNVDWLPFKRVTGEDQISIDVKNKTPYTTKLDLKLIILSNVMPFLGDDTSNSSLMRRFLPIAFNVKPAHPDPTLEARLTHPDELPGVLNWMLEGLRLLEKRGMRFPSSDGNALARDIVEESNRVISFVRDECRYTQDVTATSGELYEEYRKWCGRNGHKALSVHSFSKQLIAAGKYFGKPIERIRARTGTIYQNIQLSTAPGGWEDDS